MHNYLATSTDKIEPPPANSVVLQIWGPPPKPRPFAAAMSWLVSYFIDGFAAYGEMICPYLIDLPDPHADPELPGAVVPWPLCRQPQPDETSVPRGPRQPRDGIAARLARWLAWFRPRRDDTPSAFQHETTFQHGTQDERTLRDIGMPPSYSDDLERYLERYADHGGW